MAVQFYNFFINSYITEEKADFKASTFEIIVDIVISPKPTHIENKLNMAN